MMQNDSVVGLKWTCGTHSRLSNQQKLTYSHITALFHSRHYFIQLCHFNLMLQKLVWLWGEPQRTDGAHLRGYGREKENTFQCLSSSHKHAESCPYCVGRPWVYYVNKAKFRQRAGSDFMPNIRLSLPLRWSANLSDQAIGRKRLC